MILRIINTILLFILIGLCVLALGGLLNFGHGLGDLFYIPPIILASIGHFIVTRQMSKNSNNRYWLPIIILNFMICLAILYKATWGRGAEFPWNGELFFVS